MWAAALWGLTDGVLCIQSEGPGGASGLRSPCPPSGWEGGRHHGSQSLRAWPTLMQDLTPAHSPGGFLMTSSLELLEWPLRATPYGSPAPGNYSWGQACTFFALLPTLPKLFQVFASTYRLVSACVRLHCFV